MSKYINADDWSYDSTITQSRLINISDILSYFNGLYGQNKSVDQMIEKLEIDLINMPHVYFADVKHGEWIENDNGTYSCSLCQSWIPKEQYYYARYCLHCGADMRGEENAKNKSR